MSGVGFTGTGAHRWSVQFDDKRGLREGREPLKEQQVAKAGGPARLAEVCVVRYRFDAINNLVNIRLWLL